MNWFLIQIKKGSDTYGMVGSSESSLEELVAQAEQGRYIRLDNMRYGAAPRTYKEYSEWDNLLIPTACINPSEIIKIMQYKDDPAKAS